jgi:alcohol dehydrogenase (cytochrome c)
MMTSRFTSMLALAAALTVANVPALAAGPTDADLMNSATSTKDVLTYGMGPKGQRFSPLTAINVNTVGGLTAVYSFSLGGEKQRGQESQPIVYDGMIYVTGSYSRIFAVDARTGEEKWEYNARLPDAATSSTAVPRSRAT